MASYSAARAVHKTLTGTTADTVTIDGATRLEVLNRTGDDPLYVRTDGTTPVAEADDTDVVPAGTSVELGAPDGIVKIIGNGNAYSVAEIPS